MFWASEQSSKKELAKCYVWSVARYERKLGRLEKRMKEGLAIWIWRKLALVSWLRSLKNEVLTRLGRKGNFKNDQKNKNELDWTLHEKRPPDDECNGRNDKSKEGERRKKVPSNVEVKGRYEPHKKMRRRPEGMEEQTMRRPAHRQNNCNSTVNIDSC